MSSDAQPIQPLNYQAAINTILKSLKRDRDRQVVARRFGLGLPRRQTLEQIGQSFGITRERVRQIEKAALQKLSQVESAEITTANRVFVAYLEQEGGIALLKQLAHKLGATQVGDEAYISLLAKLVPDIELHDENDDVRAYLSLKRLFPGERLHQLHRKLIKVLQDHGKPATAGELARILDEQLDEKTLANLASVSKHLSSLGGVWGLTTWPEVNPRSIRDKTYLVLRHHKEPLHFRHIAQRIGELEVQQRAVTTQAVHNELIKDTRFVLIGRGIYALAEWGYAPGTVADMIVEVLRGEAPLHKDEIVRRVLEKRQVKTATIVLNLQEKNQFVRVAKATYALRD